MSSTVARMTSSFSSVSWPTPGRMSVVAPEGAASNAVAAHARMARMKRCGSFTATSHDRGTEMPAELYPSWRGRNAAVPAVEARADGPGWGGGGGGGGPRAMAGGEGGGAGGGGSCGRPGLGGRRRVVGPAIEVGTMSIADRILNRGHTPQQCFPRGPEIVASSIHDGKSLRVRRSVPRNETECPVATIFGARPGLMTRLHGHAGVVHAPQARRAAGRCPGAGSPHPCPSHVGRGLDPARRPPTGCGPARLLKGGSMGYEAEASRNKPTGFLFLIYMSRSRTAPYAKGKRKADGVADAINKLLTNLSIKCTKSEGVRDYYDVGVISYGKRVEPALVGELTGVSLASISAVANHPARVEERTKKEDDGAGGIAEVKVKFPIWFDAKAAGSTPMCEALKMAHTTV